MVEKYIIDPTSDGITEADGSGASWKDIWVLKVPINQTVIISPSSTFSASLVGDDTAAMPNRTRVRVVVRDSANENERTILPECPYKQVQEFQDKAKTMKFKNLKSEIILKAGERVAIQINGTDAAGTDDTDASASTFSLVAQRGR